eukprot:TRINITY_DN10843_c0_g1_i1.p1 TRINITY_DN10843_c0_g1~~TRINITY_DN10843_c0_g1_i1.p1  ORF type:complete len:248 (-),score=62.63 TRINITY_DN10843_c0_g1_i1:151-849(-)
MTALHFVNVALLTFAPHWLVSKTLLAGFEDSLAWVFTLSFLAYLGANFVKLLLSDALLPSTAEFGIYDTISSLAVGLLLRGLDVFALRQLVSRRASYFGMVAVGLCWSLVDSLTRRLVFFWMHATALEYSSDYLSMALEGNITLVLSISAAVFLGLSARKSVDLNAKPVLLGHAAAALAVEPVFTFIRGYNVFTPVFGIPYVALALQIGAAAYLGLSAKKMFGDYYLKAKKN